MAILWWNQMDVDEIVKTLSIAKANFYEWTKDKREQQEAEQRERIYDLWMRCETQEAIAKQVDIEQPTVNAKIAEFIENSKSGKSDIFGNFGKTDKPAGDAVGCPEQPVKDVVSDYSAILPKSLQPAADTRHR